MSIGEINLKEISVLSETENMKYKDAREVLVAFKEKHNLSDKEVLYLAGISYQIGVIPDAH